MKAILRTNDEYIAAISQDLYRVAIGINMNHETAIKIFTKSAQNWLDSINISEVNNLIKEPLQQSQLWLQKGSSQEKADKLLAYSKILQDYAYAALHRD